MRIRTLIVDDEGPARAKLRRLLAEEPDVEIVGEAENGREAVTAIGALAPDLVFLDVQMPELDGFGVVEAVGVERMPRVVFVTAYDEHALRAFDVHALDYLLKPFTPERLALVVRRARGALAVRTPLAASSPLDDPASLADAAFAVRLERLVDQLTRRAAPGRPPAGAPGATPTGARPPLTRLLVHHAERAFFLPVERIDRVEADRNHVRLIVGDATFTLRTTIGALAARLDPERFLRINRSEIVRLDAVKELHPWFHGDYRVVMRDGATRTWSRRYRARSAGAFTIGAEDDAPDHAPGDAPGADR